MIKFVAALIAIFWVVLDRSLVNASPFERSLKRNAAGPKIDCDAKKEWHSLEKLDLATHQEMLSDGIEWCCNLSGDKNIKENAQIPNVFDYGFRWEGKAWKKRIAMNIHGANVGDAYFKKDICITQFRSLLFGCRDGVSKFKGGCSTGVEGITTCIFPQIDPPN